MWKILHDSVFQEISPVFMQSSNFHSMKHRIYTSCIYLEAYCMMHQKYLISVQSSIYYTWTHVRYCVLLFCFFFLLSLLEKKQVNQLQQQEQKGVRPALHCYIYFDFLSIYDSGGEEKNKKVKASIRFLN